MTRFGLDSVSEVPAWAHHQLGSTVALRYLSRATGKVVTRGEYEHYRAERIDLVLVFEDMGRPDLQGYEGGKADAELAVRQAQAILPAPELPVVIRFAADYDPAGHPERADAYYDGCAAVLGHERCGPYGGYEMVAHQAARGFKALWQTYAWSAGRFFMGSQLYQFSNAHTAGGVGVDFNRVYGEDFGQWDRRAAQPADPHHYARFDDVVRELEGRKVSERATVQEYDRLRERPLLHRRRLSVLRSDLQLLADRVYAVAHWEASTAGRAVADWNAWHRGWRYQQLIHRAQGRRLA